MLLGVELGLRLGVEVGLRLGVELGLRLGVELGLRLGVELRLTTSTNSYGHKIGLFRKPQHFLATKMYASTEH